jgi:GlpG protein
VVFAFIILASFTGFRHGEIPLSFILVAIIFIGQQIYDGVMLVDNISNSAHIVGGTVGAIAGYNLNKNKAN